MVINDIESLTAQALAEVAAAQNLDHLEFLRVALLGKNGSITLQLKQLGKLPVEQRKAIGEKLNRVRDLISDALMDRKAALESAALSKRLIDERVDVTLPGRRGERAGLHPVTVLWSVLPRFLPGWVTSWLKVRKLRTTGIILRR